MYNLKGAVFVFFIMIFPAAAFGGKIEPNDDCLDTCDGMCKMCITFCGFSSDNEKDFGACVKWCALLRFSCRMFCEVDYEGEDTTGAFFTPNQSFSVDILNYSLQARVYGELRKSVFWRTFFIA